MTTEYKTYSSRSNTVRAVKTMGISFDLVEILQNEDGRWYWVHKDSGVEEVVETPEVEEVENVIPHKSQIKRPCAAVWEIAERMTIKGATRKKILEECVKQGIAYYTARTQYQSWFKAAKKDK